MEGEKQVLAGWLKKKSPNLLGLWQKRWVVLTTTELSYSDEEGGVKKAAVPLSWVTSVGILDKVVLVKAKDAKGKGDRVYELQCETEQMATEWTSAIRIAAAHNQPPGAS